MGRWITVAALAGSMSGCGLVLDLDPPAVDAGSSDGGGMDAGRDAGPPPPECRTADDCASDLCGGQVCTEGRCVDGPTTVCDDGFECTTDECVEGGGCSFVPSEGRCGDTPDQMCAGYRCVAGEGCVLTELAGACDDEIPCTRDRCRLGDGACANTPIDGRCLPGQQCVGEVGCVTVSCSDSEDCEDAPCATTKCSDDECVLDEELPNGTPCDTGDACLGPGSCTDGACDAIPIDCSDGNPCTIDSCDSSTGCVHTIRTGGICSPRACAVGTCDDVGACIETDNLCADDEDLCIRRSCGTGTCVEDRPCQRAGLRCLGSGNCGDCLPNRADCDGNGDCEHNLGFGPCPIDAGVPDSGGGDPDGGAADAATAVDASPPGDAGCAGPAATLGICPTGSLDCNGDGCCDCNENMQACSTLIPGACVPRCEGTSFTCQASEQCCCECVPAGAGLCLACPAPGI